MKRPRFGADGDVEEMAGVDVVVIAPGRGGTPGKSRLNLLRDNAANPVDLLKRSGDQEIFLFPEDLHDS